MLSIGTLVLSVALSPQSAKQTEYLKLAAATLERPVTHAELSRAVLAAEGIAAIRALFDRSLAESVILDGTRITPELGGESMLSHDGRLELVVYPDPIHPVVRELATRTAAPKGLLSFLESSEEGRFVLKQTGGLHALLYQMNDSPSDAQRELLDDVVEHALAQHFKTWTTDPHIQAEMIEKTSWRGRYAGFWHIHPPRVRGTAATEGIEPSMADMKNAVELGQFMTIVFQPDGFDLYDLAPLARARRENLSRAKVIRYRAPEWTSHFRSKIGGGAKGDLR